MVHVREEQAEDEKQIRFVNEKAFDGLKEANIVDALRRSSGSTLSLVAVVEGHVVGHILFSPVIIESSGRQVQGVGLAPLAVLPEYQRQGIGSKLVREGLRILCGLSCPFVVVVGYPDYYRRFGFETVSKYGVRSQWEGVPNESFMILILDESAMRQVSGVARYRSEFDEVQ